MKVISLLSFCLVLSGCGVSQPGTHTGLHSHVGYGGPAKHLTTPYMFPPWSGTGWLGSNHSVTHEASTTRGLYCNLILYVCQTDKSSLVILPA